MRLVKGQRSKVVTVGEPVPPGRRRRADSMGPQIRTRWAGAGQWGMQNRRRGLELPSVTLPSHIPPRRESPAGPRWTVEEARLTATAHSPVPGGPWHRAPKRRRHQREKAAAIASPLHRVSGGIGLPDRTPRTRRSQGTAGQRLLIVWTSGSSDCAALYSRIECLQPNVINRLFFLGNRIRWESSCKCFFPERSIRASLTVHADNVVRCWRHTSG